MFNACLCPCWFLVSSCLFALKWCCLVCKALAQRGLACKKAGARCCCRHYSMWLSFIAIYKTHIWILLNESNNESIWRFIGHFFANDLGLNIYIFEWSFFWRLQYHCHWSRPCFLNGTRSFLLNRTVVCSEECLAATSRAHSLSMSKPITTLRTESGAFCWSPPFLCTVYFHIFPPFPRIPSEKRETARHHNIALFFVIDIPKKIANHLGFSPGSQVSRRDIAQVLAKKQVPTVPMDQQRSIPGGTRQLARMELRQCLPPWFLHIRCSPWSWCVYIFYK